MFISSISDSDPKREADRLRTIEDENRRRRNEAAHQLFVMQCLAKQMLGPKPPTSIPVALINPKGGPDVYEGIPRGGYVMLTIPTDGDGGTRTEIHTNGPIHPALMSRYRADLKQSARPK